MTFVLGLTGSIGMGKSTTAALFAQHGVAVWDADQTVHRLYTGRAHPVHTPYAHLPPLLEQIEALVPGSTSGTGVDRDVLKRAISGDPGVLKRIEAVVAPHVAADRDAFIAASDSDIVLIDHPLLFESGTDALCDATVVVTVDARTQRARVLERGTMTPDQLDIILAKQMPNAEKVRRADYVIHTTTLDAAREQVQDVLRQIRGRRDA